MMSKRNKIIGVYAVVNSFTERMYIGSSKDIVKRYKDHIRKLKKGVHKNRCLQESYNVYGGRYFYLKVLKECLEEDLFKEEQFFIDDLWENTYNLSKIVGSGGGDTTRIPVIVLNLDGSVFQEFDCGLDVARFFGKKIIPYTKINTPSTFCRKYRIVTIDYYRDNIEDIKQWKSYTNEAEYKKQQYASRPYKFFVEKENYTTMYKSISDLSRDLNIISETVRQIMLRIKDGKIDVYTHAKTGYKLGLINKEC